MIESSAIYAGSFDPVTLGHIDLIQRARRLFPRLVVAVARNLTKEPLFTLDERVELLKRSLPAELEVEVVSFGGLLVEFAVQKRAGVLVRGLRAISDFDYEFQMALTNRKLSPEIETIYMMPNESFTYLSSQMIKEISFLGGDVSLFVPPPVVKALERFVKR